MSERLDLRIKDLDFEMPQIFIWDSKGNKDCVTMLPQSIQEPLDENLVGVRAPYK